MTIELPERADVALWRDSKGEWQGVLQGHEGPVPDALAGITRNWTRLRLPIPLNSPDELFKPQAGSYGSAP